MKIELNAEEAQIVKEALVLYRRQNEQWPSPSYDAERIAKRIANEEDRLFYEARRSERGLH